MCRYVPGVVRAPPQTFPVTWCRVEHLGDLLAEEVNWVWEPFGCLVVGRAGWTSCADLSGDWSREGRVRGLEVRVRLRLPGVVAPRLRPFTPQPEVQADPWPRPTCRATGGDPECVSGSPGDSTAGSGVRPTD